MDIKAKDVNNFCVTKDAMSDEYNLWTATNTGLYQVPIDENGCREAVKHTVGC